MSWILKKCNYCEHESYSLAKNNECPFCDKKNFVNKILSAQIKDDRIAPYIEKYKINLTSEEIENIKLFRSL